MRPDFFSFATIRVEEQVCNLCPTPTTSAVQVGFITQGRELLTKVEVPLCEDCLTFDNALNSIAEQVEN